MRKVPARRSLGAVVCRERLADLPRTAAIRISGFGIEAFCRDSQSVMVATAVNKLE